MKQENKVTLVNLVASLITFAVTLSIGFFLSPYIVKHLGAEANGFTQLASNFVTYASLITITLNSMGSRFMSVEYHKGNIEQVNKYYSSLMSANLAVISALMVPAVIIVAKLENILNISAENVFDVKILFGAVFFTFFISQVNSNFSAATYVKNRLYYSSVVSAVTALLRAALLILLFHFFKPHMYYVSIVGAFLVLLSLPINFLIKKHLLPDITFEKKYFDIKCIIKLITSGMWNTINQCGNILMTGLDLLLTNIFITPAEMGILAVAKTMPANIINLGQLVNNCFSPGLTITYVKNKEEVLSNLRWAMRVSNIFISIPIGVICVLGKEFYSLWVPSLDCRKLVILSFLSCMSFIPFSGPQVLYNVYTTTNKLKFNSITVVLGGILNFAVVYFLLKFTNLGVYAVAGVSSVVSIVRNLIVTVPYTARLLGLRWYEFYKDVINSCVCFFLVAVTTVTVKKVIVADSWISLIIAVLFSCIISLIIEIFALLKKEDRVKILKKFIKRSVKNG